MRFNFSRFLVRVRQFWTRERLVPVLGFTALALFLLNFSVFVGHHLNQTPLFSPYVQGGSVFHSDSFSERYFNNDRYSRFQEDYSKRKKCWKKKSAYRYRSRLDSKHNHDAISRLKKELDETRIIELQNIDEIPKEVVIKKLKNSPSDMDITIMIDGEVIEVSGKEDI